MTDGSEKNSGFKQMQANALAQMARGLSTEDILKSLQENRERLLHRYKDFLEIQTALLDSELQKNHSHYESLNLKLEKLTEELSDNLNSFSSQIDIYCKVLEKRITKGWKWANEMNENINNNQKLISDIEDSLVKKTARPRP